MPTTTQALSKRPRPPSPTCAPPPPAGLDPVRLVVDGEHFVVTRRPSSTGTYDFTWTSHPASYGFTLSANSEWRPDRNEMSEEVRSFLSQIDNETGDCPTDLAEGPATGDDVPRGTDALRPGMRRLMASLLSLPGRGRLMVVLPGICPRVHAKRVASTSDSRGRT